MTDNLPEIEVLLGHAGTFRRVPLSALAACLRVERPLLHAATSRLYFELLRDRDSENAAPPVAGREPTEGGSVGLVGLGPEPDDPTPEEKEPNGTDRAEPATVRVPADLSAVALAAALEEPANHAFHDALLARTDPALVRRALEETLARRYEIRGRPGAYFVAVLRRLTHPHAHV